MAWLNDPPQADRSKAFYQFYKKDRATRGGCAARADPSFDILRFDIRYSAVLFSIFLKKGG
jgi:hypothetical protein